MSSQSKRPLFITFEGGEGAGKSTLIDQVDAYLSTRGYTCVKTREPGGSKLGEYIRHWLLNRDFNIAVGKQAELQLFLAARAQHLEELILPTLAAHDVVLCDRFNDSTVVYQGVARGLGAASVSQMCDLVCHGVTPTLTFYLDVDPQVGLQRTARTHKETSAAGTLDRIEAEKLEFHKEVQKGFRTLARENPGRIKQLDANQSQHMVFEEASKYLNAIL